MNAKKRFRLPIFAKLLLAALLFFLLQIYPVQHFVFVIIIAPLMTMVTSILIFLGILSLLVESLLARVPRWMAAVPILLVVGYYAVLGYGWLRVHTIPHELEIGPPAAQMAFSPDYHAIDATVISANDLLVRYQVPVAYRAAAGTRTFIADTQTCEVFDRRQSGQPIPHGVPFRTSIRGKELCLTVDESMPPKRGLITFERQFFTGSSWGVETQTQTLVVFLDDEEIGRLPVVHVRVLPFFPFPVVGCFLHTGFSSWRCGATFLWSFVQAYPPMDGQNTHLESRAAEVDAIATMLSLTPRSPDALESLVPRT